MDAVEYVRMRKNIDRRYARFREQPE